MKFKYVKLPLLVANRATENQWATVEDSNGNLVVDVSGFAHLGDVSESAMEENALANLFSAAPELLEALQEVLHYYEEHIVGQDGDDPEREAYNKARAAIAKAYGENQ